MELDKWADVSFLGTLVKLVGAPLHHLGVCKAPPTDPVESALCLGTDKDSQSDVQATADASSYRSTNKSLRLVIR